MKKILIIIAVAIITIGWGIRVYFVNKDVDIPIVQIFSKGEEVPIGKDFFDYADENMDGYTITVLGSELLPVDLRKISPWILLFFVIYNLHSKKNKLR